MPIAQTYFCSGIKSDDNEQWQTWSGPQEKKWAREMEASVGKEKYKNWDKIPIPIEIICLP